MLCGAVCVNGAFLSRLSVNTCGAQAQLTQLCDHKKDVNDLKVSLVGSVGRNFQICKGTVVVVSVARREDKTGEWSSIDSSAQKQ